VHQFTENLSFPIQIKVKRPYCAANKDRESSHSNSTCEVKNLVCPATVKLNVNECFQEKLQFPVEFKVKRPTCQKKVKKPAKKVTSSSSSSSSSSSTAAKNKKPAAKPSKVQAKPK